MVKMSHGPRAGSRMKMTKRASEKGMPKVNEFLKKFSEGDLAAISIEPSVHSGMPHHGFQGLTGRVVRSQGSCYMVKVKVGGKEKMILAGPVHLKKIDGV
ncbi:MAG: 50S ribosomal protein L21e [Thermoplasmataceae archaeon]|jgi:large subunit ribosomal protein L21e